MQTKQKQAWGPFLREVLGPNVPWLWYILNTVAAMSVNTMFVGLTDLSSQFLSGAVLDDNSILYHYLGLMLLMMVVSLLMGISQSWASFVAERNIQRRLWTKMVRMPMRLYDKQAPSSLISRVTSDTSQITYSLNYVFTLITDTYTAALVLVQIWMRSHFIAIALLCVIPYVYSISRYRNMLYYTDIRVMPILS